MSSQIAKSQRPVNSEEDWETVCLLDDLVPDSGVCVLFNHKQIAIFKINTPDSVYAIDNYDPFSEANVLSRGIIGSLSGKLMVASPIFKQHFYLETGQCIEDKNVSVKTYAIRIAGNDVQLQK